MTGNPTADLLTIHNLSKGYRMGSQTLSVLNGFSLQVAEGEMVAIMGPSGSGKTTLLNAIAGIDPPDEGSIALRGERIDMSSERRRTTLRRHDIGIVFQFFNLLPALTVRENVHLPLLVQSFRDHAHRREEVEAMLARIGLAARADHYPAQLSGGEMQLVSIARALIHQPAMVLADEPTGNVNPAAGRAIMRILRATVKERRTGLILVTHSPEHAAWADRIGFLQEGRIVDFLTHDGAAEDAAPIHRKLLELGI
ncbi:MAG: ABC transporter ATP-binding protein [Magnetococcales bacterium]|nr:ABC transporter ATP-binding protein [Magnetococcales bacterium]